MTTTNTFGIIFYIKRQKEKSGKAPIVNPWNRL